MAGVKKITWSESAFTQFETIYDLILRDSLQNAEKFRKDIFKQIEKAAKYPEGFSPEYYKLQNDGSYRYFEKHRVRVTYKILEEEILIVRIRHTSRKPRNL